LQFFSLDLRNYKWEQVWGRGDVPQSRDEHSAVGEGDAMIVFGGYLDLGRTNAIYRYFFDENRWEKVKVLSKEEPEARSGHSALIYQE
jgi:N-acetylneuraminic acid mutarotase